jgi:hypothetical protein
MARNTKQAQPERKKPFEIMVEGARMINSSLFVKDTYEGTKGKPGTPAYKIEIAIPKNDKDFEAVLDKLVNEGLDHLEVQGDLDLDGGDVSSGIKDGDVLAKKREKNGKQGDAYKGHYVIRAKTIFNKHGEDGPGGITVLDENAEPIVPPDTSDIYNGCYVNVLLSVGSYVDSETGNDSLNYYLTGVQKVKDGERLVAQRDVAAAFKPIGRARSADGEPAGRRRRG